MDLGVPEIILLFGSHVVRACVNKTSLLNVLQYNERPESFVGELGRQVGAAEIIGFSSSLGTEHEDDDDDHNALVREGRPGSLQRHTRPSSNSM